MDHAPSSATQTRPLPKTWQAQILRNLPAVLFLITCLLYLPTRHFDFSGVDDEQHLNKNPSIATANAEGLVNIWSQPYFNLYIPVTYTLWWTIRAGLQQDASPVTPQAFHLANTIVHAINALLVFYLILSSIGSRLSAFAGSLFFAVHPIQAEAVCWISGMKDLFSAFWLLLALILGRSALISQRENIWQSWLAPVAFAMAVLAKPGAVVGPVLLFLLSLSILESAANGRRLVSQLLIWSLLASGGVMLAQWAQPPVVMPFTITATQRIFVAAWSLSFYVAKLFWPNGLTIDYALPPDAIIEYFRQAWLITVTLLTSFGLAAIGIRWRKSFGVGPLIFLVCLCPTLGFVPYYFQPISNVADRYAYLALVGPAFTIAWVTHQMLASPNRSRLAGATVMLGALALATVTVTVKQIQVWQNPLTLFSHAIATRPQSWFSHFNLGSTLVKEGNLTAARQHLEQTIRLRPWFPDAHYNLGIVSAMEGKSDEAAQHFDRAARLDAQTDKAVYREN